MGHMASNNWNKMENDKEQHAWRGRIIYHPSKYQNYSFFIFMFLLLKIEQNCKIRLQHSKTSTTDMSKGSSKMEYHPMVLVICVHIR